MQKNLWNCCVCQSVETKLYVGYWHMKKLHKKLHTAEILNSYNKIKNSVCDLMMQTKISFTN